MFRTVFIFLLPFVTIFKQSLGTVQLGFRDAEECRRVTKAARQDNEKLYTARCRLKSSETVYSKFSLKSSIPSEWSWTLEHGSTVSGQVIVSDHDSVFMISQKQCIERKDSSGHPARRVYHRNDSNDTLFYDVIWSKDYFRKSNERNIYGDCTTNKQGWHEFHGFSGNTTAASGSVKQFVMFGSSMNEFEFDYDSNETQSVFKEELNEIIRTEKHRTYLPENFLDRHSPIFVHGYTSETGLGILASSNEIFENRNGNSSTRFKDDPSFIVWSRAMQAKSALADKSRSLFEEVEPPELLESIQLIIELFVAAGFTIQAYKSAMSVRPLGNSIFVHGEDSWQIVREQTDFGFQGDWYKMSHDLVYEFGGALAALVFGFKTMYDSSWWWKVRLLVTQGGLITYGEETENGTVFYVSHWYNVEVVKLGNVWVNRVVWGIVVLLGLMLVGATYLFSVSRQVKVHLPSIQIIVRTVHAPIQAVITILARILPDHWNVFNSYEKQFYSTSEKLCNRYFRKPFERKCTSTLLGRLELVAHKEKDVCIYKRPWYGGPSNNVTRNDIEKASEILAADTHGRLSYFQALAILFDSNLTEAVNRFSKNRNCFLSSQDIKHLAMVYYIDGLFVPDSSGRGFPLHSFRRLKTSNGVEHGSEDNLALAPIIRGGRITEYAIMELSGQVINE